MRARITPLGALGRGLVAGALGSAAQSLFFVVTKPLAPRAPQGTFVPAEPVQLEETATATIARRFVEGLLGRQLPASRKELGAQLVHYGFGAGWGGLYGLARASFPPLRGLGAALGFGWLVWLIGDELMLPAFRLAGWPQRYPPKVHAYAFVAHVPYAAATWAAWQVMDRPLKGTSFPRAGWRRG